MMQQVLNKLDVLECFEDKKRAIRIGETYVAFMLLNNKYSFTEGGKPNE